MLLNVPSVTHCEMTVVSRHFQDITNDFLDMDVEKFGVAPQK